MLTPAFASSLAESLQPHSALLGRLSGTRVLITGANGLIPGTLLASLAVAKRDLGITVDVTAVCHRNRQHLDALITAGFDNINVVTGDLAEGLPQELRMQRFDYVLHGASLASPRKYLAQRVATMKVNVLATLQLLEKAREDATANLLYIGSGEIYGSPDVDDVPTPESYIPRVDHLVDRACYSESKRFAESLCQQFSLETAQTVSVVRPIHVFGPGLLPNDGRVVADFLADARAGRPIVVNSDGSDRRAFCYSLDSNLMLLHVLLRHVNGFDVFNVGNPDNDVSIAQLARMVASLAGVEVDIRGLKPASALGTPARSAPAIGKIVQRFGVKPRYGLKEALKLTLEWMRDS
ncbi:MAG TPA: NAD-dependent epimerase/dehydratase family protein [Pseudomonadales bacterium]